MASEHNVLATKFIHLLKYVLLGITSIVDDKQNSPFLKKKTNVIFPLPGHPFPQSLFRLFY
jgi:hypothetical protein